MGNKSESVVQIDEHNLDKECINLPSAYLAYAHKSADAKRDVGELNAKLDVVKAELDFQIREHPAKYGLEKVTESAIKSTILKQDQYQEAEREVREAQHTADLHQAVVWALEHKKRALTLLVELHGMGYFSNPKVSERGRDAVNDMTRKKLRSRREDD